MNVRTHDPAVNGREPTADRSEAKVDREALRNAVNRLEREVRQLREQIRDPDAPQLLDVREVAETLSLSERTVRSLISGDELDSVKLKRRRLIPASSVQELVQEHLDGR